MQLHLQPLSLGERDQGALGSPNPVVNPGSVVHSLDKNGMLRMSEYRKESIGTDSKFVVVRPDQSHEKVLGTRGFCFEASDDLSRDRSI